MKKDKDCLYIFFENHKRKGFVNKYFGNGVRNHAQKIRKKCRTKIKTINHIGFLFYDNEWKVAELNYFSGGRIIRNVNENDIKDFQVCQIINLTNEVKTSIYDLFTDKLQKKSWFYSWRRYNFWKCIEYIKNSKHKAKILDLCKLYIIGIRFLPKPQNAGWTCIETTFHILNEHQCNPFKTKLSPYELLIELNELHTKKRQQTL